MYSRENPNPSRWGGSTSRSDSVSNYGQEPIYHHELGEVDPDHILDEIAREKGHRDFMALVDEASKAYDNRGLVEDILGILFVAGGALASAGLAAKGIIGSAGAKALASKLGWSSSAISSAVGAGSSGGAAASSTGLSGQSANDALAINSLLGTGAKLSSSESSQSSNNSLWNALSSALVGGSSSQPSLASSIISSLTGFGTEYASSLLNFSNMEKLIDKQNSYNTPAAQMQRFADAGLNPNLIYGMGSNGNQPQAGSVAPVDFSTAQREAKMQMLEYQSNLAQRQAQINLMNSEAKTYDEQAEGQRLSNAVYLQGWLNEQNLKLQTYNNLIEENRKLAAEADSASAKAHYQAEISRLEKEKAQFERNIAETQARYAETREITGAVGDVLRFNFGAGLSRSRVSTSKAGK